MRRANIRLGYENRRRSHNCRLAPDKRRERSRPGVGPRAATAQETICTMRLNVVVPHGKERGHSNGRCHDWCSWSHPTCRSERRRTLSSEELGDEIRFLPGCQSHRHPVFDHCALDWIGGSGVVVADTVAIGLPEQLLRHRPRRLPAIHHHARHDHGDLSAHRAVPGGLRKLPDPADGSGPGHGFPYVNMISYWVYLLAVLVLVASFFMPGGPTGSGWTLYPPQAILSGTPGRDWGIILMLVSLILFIIGFTMGGLNYVVTALQSRTRGMTLMRMPLTVWGIVTATVLALLAFPALFVGCVMLLFDRILGTSFFIPAVVEMGQHLKYSGGSPLLFQHLFWFFGHPEVYIVAVPAFGIVSDLISTHARKNIFGYRMMVWAIVAIGALSFVVWAHHMYVSGMNPY